jgi:hypothetical protein
MPALDFTGCFTTRAGFIADVERWDEAKQCFVGTVTPPTQPEKEGVPISARWTKHGNHIRNEGLDLMQRIPEKVYP